MSNLESSQFISAISVAELYGGVREGKERKGIDSLIKSFTVVPVTQEIAKIGGLYVRDFSKSHGVGLADALIAATAEKIGAMLVTLIRKHFPMLKDVIVPYQRA